MLRQRTPQSAILVVLIAAAVLLVIYLVTLQTIPNGSSNYYMIDVGETQIVLNRWGTLHATGYPHYVITGNLLTALGRGLGLPPLTAAALVSLLWEGVALGLFMTLAYHLTRRLVVSAVVMVLFGLTRTVWIHGVVAEIYSFTLAILAGLFLLALWRQPVRGRLFWLALLGGIGVAHHRALVTVAPALVGAIWPALAASARQHPRRLLRDLVISLGLGLLGLLPYIYLPLRATAGATWVYGAPDTWPGLLDQFMGVEANRFVGLPADWQALMTNVSLVNGVLITDLALPGLLAGLAGLLWAVRDPALRRASVTLCLSGGLAYAFHVLLYTDILSALILIVTFSLAMGWVFLADRIVRAAAARFGQAGWRGRLVRESLWMAPAAALAVVLIVANFPFIRGLVTDPTGLETIALAEGTPPGAVLMIPWGTRHFAVGIAQDVDPSLAGPVLQDVILADHQVDVAGTVAAGMLVTPDYTFFSFPLAWWAQQLGEPPVLRAAGPHLVQVDSQPVYAEVMPEAFGPQRVAVICDAHSVSLDVTWVTPDTPTLDLSVFVHAWDEDDNLIAQGDQAAPIYGWRPLTTWRPGEAVRDIYPVPGDPAQVVRLTYGFYTSSEAGFENVYAYETTVNCPSTADAG